MFKDVCDWISEKSMEAFTLYEFFEKRAVPLQVPRNSSSESNNYSQL